jgi:K(+)-stimulated pyrophosphate-energized sodium pump
MDRRRSALLIVVGSAGLLVWLGIPNVSGIWGAVVTVSYSLI